MVSLTDPPSVVLLLRATLKQSQHDFDGSLRDLDRLIARQPTHVQALLTRATVLTVRGRYTDAVRDCGRLEGFAFPLIVTTCLASPRSLSGEADSAYREIVQALSRQRGASPARVWALTLAAEIATRRGDARAAERHFTQALAIDPRDPYLRGAYADFLLDNGRERDVVSLLHGDVQNDALLLRLTLAERSVDEEHASFERHRVELASRFEAARRRGDALHRREEARFRLSIDDDAQAALALARANWRVQREPADLRILADAAKAANDSDARKSVADWIRQNHWEDITLTAAKGEE